MIDAFVRVQPVESSTLRGFYFLRCPTALQGLRVAMELMRHSDRKLTDKIYTDSNLLPLGEVVRNLPEDEPLTEILTEISGKTCRNGSRVGEIEPLEKAAKTALHAASRLELSQSGDSETLVEVAGIEPASRNTSDPASTRVVHLII